MHRHKNPEANIIVVIKYLMHSFYRKTDANDNYHQLFPVFYQKFLASKIEQEKEIKGKCTENQESKCHDQKMIFSIKKISKNLQDIIIMHKKVEQILQ